MGFNMYNVVMNNIMRPALKLIYNVLAKPGLGNPHTPNENEPMLAGAKPVSMTPAQNITTELQEAINRGDILKINEHDFEKKHKIYCHASELTNAEKAAQILEQSWRSDYALSEENAGLLSAFFNLKSETLKRQGLKYPPLCKLLTEIFLKIKSPQMCKAF
jgi:hypothetical protein